MGWLGVFQQSGWRPHAGAAAVHLTDRIGGHWQVHHSGNSGKAAVPACSAGGSGTVEVKGCCLEDAGKATDHMNCGHIYV